MKKPKYKTLIQNRLELYEGIIDGLEIDLNRKTMLKAGWLDFVKLMECLTDRNLKKYTILNLLIIICGILIPVTINAVRDDYHPKVFGTFLGIVVSVSASLNQSYKFNDRWRHFRSISEALKIEGAKYLSLSEKYHSYETHSGQAFKVFMANIEIIKEGQIDTYMKKIVVTDGKAQEIEGNKTDPKNQTDYTITNK